MKAPQKNRRRRRRRISWIHRLMTIATILVVAVAISVSTSVLADWEPQQVPNQGENTLYVQYEILNVRTSPWGGKILTQLHRGDTVETTGNSKEFYGGNSDLAVWQEITLADGTTGWVVSVALVNADQYQTLFGG